MSFTWSEQDELGRLRLATVVTAATAAASARRDYLEQDRLSWRTQALMWPAYLLGGAVVITSAIRARATGTPNSRSVGVMLSAAGLTLFAAGARPFASFAQLAGRETGDLITDGAYRYSRNPQYAGNVLLSAGTAVAARSVPGAVFTLAVAAAYRAYVVAEEAHLERAFGSEYRRYRDRTPRWFGSPREDDER
ncbi:MAG: isoprenylcysteine carboxylmethyltransferase family protein [Actinomycetota bacterium]|nr:isoprenylcysteine carboxylmethyltransferase family protein [Actinomycetota bacterium]